MQFTLALAPCRVGWLQDLTRRPFAINDASNRIFSARRLPLNLLIRRRQIVSGVSARSAPLFLAFGGLFDVPTIEVHSPWPPNSAKWAVKNLEDLVRQQEAHRCKEWAARRRAKHQERRFRQHHRDQGTAMSTPETQYRNVEPQASGGTNQEPRR